MGLYQAPQAVYRLAGSLAAIIDLAQPFEEVWNSARASFFRRKEYAPAECSGCEGELPCDAKLVLRIEALGDAFLGLQTQVVLDNVQGRDYPYLYCVLVPRPELGMLQKTFDRPAKGIIAEPKQQEQDNVEIVVIRQETTRTNGYHTPPAACAAIFTYALAQTRRLVPAKASSAQQ